MLTDIELKMIQLWLINSGQAEKKVPSVSYQSSLTYHGCAVNTIRFSPSGNHQLFVIRDVFEL